uniref:CG4730-like protein n=1 Tax=Drosophila buzzatii TaxID=7264 RepID=I3RSE5_DROBU|nr:CG4730-like protein [Drosophila buzzatii]
MSVSIAEIVIEDLSKCCRICFAQPHRDQMLDMSLIYDEEAQLTYYDCYEICTKDNLRECGENEPHTLCKHCGVELQWAYDFHKKAAIANKQLQNMQSIVGSEAEDADQTEQYNNVEVFDVMPAAEDMLNGVEESVADQSSSDNSLVSNDTLDSAPTVVSMNVRDVVPRQRVSGPFNCQFCQKVFRNHSCMLKHQLIHLSDRPHFQCNACDRFYLTKQALKVHVDTQHKKSGKMCSICGKVFAIAKSLEIHMRYHNGYFPFDCDQCDRKFAQRSQLNVHRQVKHSSARFQCEFASCGKLFTSSSALRNHECTHTEMPFECNICHQGFPARYKLRLHAQRKHNMQLTLEQLETMRKFHIMRSKRVLAKLGATQLQQQQEEEGEQNAIDAASNDS